MITVRKAFKAGLTVKKKFQESVDSSASPEKRILLDESVSCSPNSITSPVTSTPAKTARPVTTVPISPVRPVILEGSDGEDRGKTVVEVKIQWPCNKTKSCHSSITTIIYAKFKTRTAGY